MFRALAATAALVTLLAGCGRLEEQEAGGPRPSDPAARFAEQKLQWTPCVLQPDPAVKFECTTMEVPMDYGTPGGPTFRLALNRLPATDQATKLGALVTNPGGPGASGVEFVLNATNYFSPALRARYDIVGMDPRGVGESDPVVCKVTEGMAHAKTALEHATNYANGCEERSGAILQHVVTPNVARDLYLLRTLMGEQKLNFYGISYGTVIGQFFAQMFPKYVGRMVWDSVANPTGWPADPSAQALGFEAAFRVMLDDCVKDHGCPLGDDRNDILKRVSEAVHALNVKPLRIPGKGEPSLSGEEVLGVLQQAAYSESRWPVTTKALAAALRGDGRQIRKLSGSLAGSKVKVGNEYPGSFTAISCPHMRPEERTAKAAKAAGLEAVAAAPLFGIFEKTQRLTCAQWPVASLPEAGRALPAPGAPPILLVQNSHDAATPVQWARGVYGQMAGDAALVVNESGGHGFYPMGKCTKKVVDGYLLSGNLPDKGTSCADKDKP